MNYQIQKTEPDRAWEHALERPSEYPYALVYLISDLILCRTQDLPDIDWPECLEARFFGPDKELHIYEEDGGLQAVQVIEEGGGLQAIEKGAPDYMDRRYQLKKRFRGAGALLRVREYLAYDEDGQVFVSLTRLAGIEEV